MNDDPNVRLLLRCMNDISTAVFGEPGHSAPEVVDRIAQLAAAQPLDDDALSDAIVLSLRRYGYADGDTLDTLHERLFSDLRGRV